MEHQLLKLIAKYLPYNSPILFGMGIFGPTPTPTPTISVESIRDCILGRIDIHPGMDINNDGHVNVADLIHLILNQ